uniref:Uncharacterized protein n=1 Tax=Arundo donax TaxID=35708 RepID=A0A0A9ER51_ARUDO
MGSRLDGQ